MALLVYSIPAVIVVLVTLPFENLHPSWETVGWLSNDIKEKDENPLVALVLLSPWLLAGFLFCMAAILAYMSSENLTEEMLDQYEETQGKIRLSTRMRILKNVNSHQKQK